MAALWLDFKFGCPVCLRLQKRVSLQVNSCVLVFCMLLKPEFFSSSCVWFWSFLECLESLTVDTQDLLSACCIGFSWCTISGKEELCFSDDCLTLMLLLAGVTSLQGFIFLAQLKATVQGSFPSCGGLSLHSYALTNLCGRNFMGQDKAEQHDCLPPILLKCSLHFPSK